MDDEFFSSIEFDQLQFNKKRPTCSRCRRPIVVCWCHLLPAKQILISTDVIILQHPCEEKRAIQTAKILELVLDKNKFRIIKGRKFNSVRTPQIAYVFNNPHAAILYPCPGAEDLRLVASSHNNSAQLKHLIVLDGTWFQAKGIYNSNYSLHSMRKVALMPSPSPSPQLLRHIPTEVDDENENAIVNINENDLTYSNMSNTTDNDGMVLKTDLKSRFVIRTQPFAHCVSTVEAVALALSHIEGRTDIIDVVLKPLDAICNYQLAHGAVPHEDRQTRINEGKCEGKNRKNSFNKLRVQSVVANKKDENKIS